MKIEQITPNQADEVSKTEEGQFADVKAIEIGPGKLTKAISAFANADGGDLFIGIDEADVDGKKVRNWRGFADVESANAHLATFEPLFPLGSEFVYEFLKCDGKPGLVLHILINKTKAVRKASDGTYYFRKGAQSLPANTPELIKRLEYLKGISSFEGEPLQVPKALIIDSPILNKFIQQVVPTVDAEAWLKKQVLIVEDRPVVAGVLLFSEEPQAVLPKRCGIKVYHYKTRESVGFREALAFDPKTIEGCLYDQIKAAVSQTTEIAEQIPRLGEGALEAIKYPRTTLHEIITNAVIHRDYSITDDIHIRIFENRIEVESPGKLPSHITPKNILKERAARNGAIQRMLNKFPDPPNKDVGEGLNTAFAAMHELGLKEPIVLDQENSVLVLIKHEPLASPEKAIMDYLDTNESINNSAARQITHIKADYNMKNTFNRMVKKDMIEQIPGSKTSNTAYRKKSPTKEVQVDYLKPDSN